MREEKRNLQTIPVGSLGLIPLESCKELGEAVDKHIVRWREHREHEHAKDIAFRGYKCESYTIPCSNPRFASGEAKGMIHQTVR